MTFSLFFCKVDILKMFHDFLYDFLAPYVSLKNRFMHAIELHHGLDLFGCFCKLESIEALLNCLEFWMII